MSKVQTLVYHLALCSSLGLASAGLADTIGFLGDSISTGGASHPALRFDLDVLQDVFADKVDLSPQPAYYEAMSSFGETIENPALPPQRLAFSPREFDNPFSWVADHAMQSLSSRYLDTEEYSWAYLLARKRKSRPNEILIAARDGEKSQHATQQVDRLLDATESQAPRHLFVFFTGNDLCAPQVEFATEANEFTANLESALRYYMRNAKSEQALSHIWLLDPLGILQIVSSPSILNRPVQAYGQNLSCRDLQSGRFKSQTSELMKDGLTEKFIFNMIFGQGPHGYCPSLFAVHESQGADIQLKLAGLLSAYRQGLESLVKKLANAHPSFRIHHLHETADIIFEAEDLANDCFHLSLQGQLKLASTVDAAMQKVLP
ncbi:MAG: SGNH/GDSL hydrolase family protein [Proteobacteria bacterium]|nr:SGNH/GDSL hydrolase family protein [Pseudomonadota bacterium]